MDENTEPLVRPNRSKVKGLIRSWLVKMMPLPWFLLLYRRTAPKLSSRIPRDQLFKSFLGGTKGPCLQIGIKDGYGEKFGFNWVSVDKYDHQPAIDCHDDIQALGFADDSFNSIVCWSVLEHVPQPEQAIAEMYRVLKPGGTIWVQLPFLFPYHADPHDYWRVTPSGLRMWMREFEEIDCACDYFARTSIASATFFHGRKPLVQGNRIKLRMPSPWTA